MSRWLFRAKLGWNQSTASRRHTTYTRRDTYMFERQARVGGWEEEKIKKSGEKNSDNQPIHTREGDLGFEGKKKSF